MIDDLLSYISLCSGVRGRRCYYHYVDFGGTEMEASLSFGVAVSKS
jgi:hypothetical protein